MLIDSIKQVWNDDTLYGHCLTILPNQLWDFATSDKLITYTEPDPGTAERVFLIFEKFKKTEILPDGSIDVQMRTNFLLFKYAEISFRRTVGTGLTVGASISLAPLGFAIKIIQKGIR